MSIEDVIVNVIREMDDNINSLCGIDKFLQKQLNDLKIELQDLTHQLQTIKVDIYNDKVSKTTKEYEIALSQIMKPVAYDRDSV